MYLARCSILDRHLPFDIVETIARHLAADVIRMHWIRYSHYAHIRHPVWPTVRENLQSLRFFYLFPSVRREWRREPESWLRVALAGSELCILYHECAQGLWGKASTRLSLQ